MNVVLKQTDEYDVLVKFFVENGLEFDGDEEVDTDIIKCWKMTHGQDEHLMGGAVLAKREGKYIIDGIAIEAAYRKLAVGKILLNRVKKEVESLGGNEIYLVARAPGFFRKNGFVQVEESQAPNFFECKQCPQYKVSCYPEIMKWKLER